MMEKINITKPKTVLAILVFSSILIMASISAVSPAQIAIAQDGTENSTDTHQSDGGYKHGEEKDCPFKDKGNSTSYSEEST